MKNGNKQLDELLRQFMDEDHIHELKEDLSFADQLFAAHPVPDVHQETIASIQVKVRLQPQLFCWRFCCHASTL
ncbi:MAG: hypothetical protein ACYTEU_14545 [Planctomycetota bacterium]|jgi:hypothetical protein